MTTMYAITRAQARALEALCDATLDGWPASVEEIAAGMGVASKSTAWDHLVELENLGLAMRNPRRPRAGFRPTPSGRATRHAMRSWHPPGASTLPA